jgi:hypothetical protein
MIPDVLTDDRTQVAAAEADRVMEPCTLVLFGASGDLATHGGTCHLSPRAAVCSRWSSA